MTKISREGAAKYSHKWHNAVWSRSTSKEHEAHSLSWGWLDTHWSWRPFSVNQQDQSDTLGSTVLSACWCFGLCGSLGLMHRERWGSLFWHRQKQKHWARAKLVSGHCMWDREAVHTTCIQQHNSVVKQAFFLFQHALNWTCHQISCFFSFFFLHLFFVFFISVHYKGLLLTQSFKAGPPPPPPPPWLSFWSFLTFLHHGIEDVVKRRIFCENFVKKFKGKVGQMCHRSCSLA